jgi:putative FmdB family regulatory protein
MPTYDYKCTDCDDVFEIVHGLDDTVESCPKCGGKVRRLFHPVGIIFKGSGFYKTDNRSGSDNGGSKPSPPQTEKKAEKAADKGSADKKESAPQKDAGKDKPAS